MRHTAATGNARARHTGLVGASALLLALVLPLALVVSGCAGTDARAETGARRSLTVSVAASLRYAFPDLAALFTRQTGVEVVLNTGASGVLVKQVAARAPVDVLASASEAQIRPLIVGDRITPGSMKPFAQNELVLATRAGDPLHLAASADAFGSLAAPRVRRVAIGNPNIAPHGAAAVQTLRNLGLFDAVRPKLVYAENVAQTHDYLSRGEVDAALLFASEAGPGSGLTVLAVAPARSHDPLVDVICVTARAADPALAERFLEVVLSPQGQAILARHGFAPPPDRTTP